MPKAKDTRNFAYNRLDAANFGLGESATIGLTDSAAKISDELPGNHRIKIERIDAFTGSPSSVRSIDAPSSFGVLPGQGPTDSILINDALNHVASISVALGFMPGQNAEFVPDPSVKKTSAGTSVVTLQQQYRGTPVFLMERTVIFGGDGQIKNATGNNVDLPPDLDTSPVVSLQSAIKAAAAYMATPGDDLDSWTGEPLLEDEIDVDNYQPEILGRVSLPSQPSVLSKGPFGENIPAHLVLFYQGSTTRLGWHFVISTPTLTQQYVIIVEADPQTENRENPKVLYAQKTSSDMASRGMVWVHNPGVNQQRAVVDFPLGLSAYPLDASTLSLPPAFPHSWVDNGGTMAIGNCTVAVTGSTSNSISGSDNDGDLVFDPGDNDAQGDIQVINIFYFCNYMHDFFYMLGFDERHGNFQKINLTGFGTANDAVLARAHPGPVTGTANMLTPADGIGAEMNMGLVVGTNRHTAFDSDVVFHEFTHGVSKRLVGGKLDARGLQEPQSRGMGEGWSDYFALTVQNCNALIQDTSADEKIVTGDWVSGRGTGIRLAPYNDSYPATYGNLGNPPYHLVHAIGEVWCATLMKMNRDFGAALNDKVRGHRIGWQAVVDGLKLSPSNPSFLDARDSILQALGDLRSSGRLSIQDHTLLNRAAWHAFARFGMGPNATTIGPSLHGIHEDRHAPVNL